MTHPKDSTICSVLSEYDNVPRLVGSRRMFDPCCELNLNGGRGGKRTTGGTELGRKNSSFRTPPKRFRFPIEEEQQRDDEGGKQDKIKMVDDFYVENSSSSDGPRRTATPERPSETSSVASSMGRTPSVFFYFLIFLAEILLFGVLILSLVWVQFYRGGFAWTDIPVKQFNLHPVLMVTGFIFLMGHAMLVYRLFSCCNKIGAKVLHTILHLMAIPCIVVSMFAVFDSRNLLDTPVPNLWSLHSWMGLVTLGLYALQFVFGFFSFWMLTLCEEGTASFRACLMPIHSSFGITTFMLAVATCCTGLTGKAMYELTDPSYSTLPEEAYYYNAMGLALIALAIIMGYLLHNAKYQTPSPVAFVEAPTSNSHYVMAQHGYAYREKHV